MIFSVNSLSEFKVGEYPFISGTTQDNNENPLSNVEIQINFPSQIMITTTDSKGEFSITSPVAAEPGEYVVTVYATKDTMNLKTQIKYQVIDYTRITTSDTSKNV